MKQPTRYNYIICGAGCAGLSLAYYLSQTDLKGKNILLLDKDRKDKSDRTWCYWEKGNSHFDKIVQTQWNELLFATPAFQKKMNISPYAYKKIRGLDFYKFILNHLSKYSHIHFKNELVHEISEDTNGALVKTQQRIYESDQVFVSYQESIDFSSNHHVLQHFKGWEIKTNDPVFESKVATFMDFRTDQNGETRFLYVLPTSAQSALVELAVFSNKIWSQEDYDNVIEAYIKNTLEIRDYKVSEKEFGIIPMSTYPFEKANTKHIKYIGTAGGWVKASSGFAFERIQRLSKTLAEALVNGENIDLVLKSVNNRYRFYDRIFLNVILTGKKSGADVFTSLFKSLPPTLVFKFLDEETSFLEDMRLFTGPPTWPFIKGFFSELV